MSTRIQQAHARRHKTALVCAKKLDDAASALRAFLSACNDCNDESASLSLQGKGVDGRETLIASLAEYSSYLSFKFDRPGSAS